MNEAQNDATLIPAQAADHEDRRVLRLILSKMPQRWTSCINGSSPIQRPQQGWIGTGWGNARFTNRGAKEE
jgi:hypothetical protein